MSRRYTEDGRANLKRLGFESDTSSESEVEIEQNAAGPVPDRMANTRSHIQAQRRPAGTTPAGHPIQTGGRVYQLIDDRPNRFAARQYAGRAQQVDAAPAPRATAPYRQADYPKTPVMPSIYNAGAQAGGQGSPAPSAENDHSFPIEARFRVILPAAPRPDQYSIGSQYNVFGPRQSPVINGGAPVRAVPGTYSVHSIPIGGQGRPFQKLLTAKGPNPGRGRPTSQGSEGCFMANGHHAAVDPFRHVFGPDVAAGAMEHGMSKGHGGFMQDSRTNTSNAASHGSSPCHPVTNFLMSNGFGFPSPLAGQPPFSDGAPRGAANYTFPVPGQGEYMYATATSEGSGAGSGVLRKYSNLFDPELPGWPVPPAAPDDSLQEPQEDVGNIFLSQENPYSINASANGFLSVPQSSESSHISQAMWSTDPAVSDSDLDSEPPTKKARIGSKQPVRLSDEAAAAQRIEKASRMKQEYVLKSQKRHAREMARESAQEVPQPTMHTSSDPSLNRNFAQNKAFINRDVGGEVIGAMDRVQAMNEEYQQEELDRETYDRGGRKTRGRARSKTRQQEDGYAAENDDSGSEHDPSP